jgi:hypothetical protein
MSCSHPEEKQQHVLRLGVPEAAYLVVCVKWVGTGMCSYANTDVLVHGYLVPGWMRMWAAAGGRGNAHVCVGLYLGKVVGVVWECCGWWLGMDTCPQVCNLVHGVCP